MITSIDVNRFGIASVWLKEQGLLLFVPTVAVGDYRVVCFDSLYTKLQRRGYWWPESLRRN